MPTVTVAFDRQPREWPAGVAQNCCSQLCGEIGGDKAVLAATDGSFIGDNKRAGWGYHICFHDTTIAEESECHTVYTSSTRMEFEVIQRAQDRLALLELDNNNTVCSRSLTKIQSGNLHQAGLAFVREILLKELFGCMYLVMLVC